jgi:hypothetical protein
MTIWKFPIEIIDEVLIDMPRGAVILSIQTQGTMPCILALVDPEQPKCKRLILTRRTGQHIDFSGIPFVGTYQFHNGTLIFHVFDGGEKLN